MSGRLYAVTLATALACGLVGGVCFAFSSFIMAGLKKLAPAQGVAAMQSINKMAVTPVFLTVFLGAAVGCVALIIWAVRIWGERPAPWLLAGALVFLVGVTIVSFSRNIPLNDGLDTVNVNAADVAARWSAYLDSWMPWNHVRSLSGLVAAGLLTVGLGRR